MRPRPTTGAFTIHIVLMDCAYACMIIRRVTGSCKEVSLKCLPRDTLNQETNGNVLERRYTLTESGGRCVEVEVRDVSHLLSKDAGVDGLADRNANSTAECSEATTMLNQCKVGSEESIPDKSECSGGGCHILEGHSSLQTNEGCLKQAPDPNGSDEGVQLFLSAE